LYFTFYHGSSLKAKCILNYQSTCDRTFYIRISTNNIAFDKTCSSYNKPSRSLYSTFYLSIYTKV